MFSEEQVINVEFLPNDIVDGATYIIKQSNPNSYTHGMFKYPCKFIPEIPRWGIKKYSKKENTIVFDPFSGSGTTLLEANINGLNAYGTEIDDIAKLIIKVKTTRLDNNQINELDKIFEEIISIIYKEDAIAYIPLINNLEHWFQNDVIKQLGKMKNYIDSINDSEIRDFFKLCMVSIVKRVSNADDASPKPYVSRKVIKIPPTVQKEFTSIFNRYKQMLIETNEIKKFGNTSLLEGNALDFEIPNIDLVITSPPYINAFDYGRTMRLENLWLATLTEECLNYGGKYIIVIGNSNIRKVNIESWKVLNDLATNIGFVRINYFNYVIQNPYIRIPRKEKGGKINNDYVLVLERR